MAKANNKTVANSGSVTDFINGVEPLDKRADSEQILQMMTDISGEEPVMWGASIVGFGTYHYVYDSGREGDFMKVGFSPRKQNLTLYIMPGFDRYDDLLSRLGRHKLGKSCLYIKRLSDVDTDVLRELIKISYDYMTEKYG